MCLPTVATFVAGVVVMPTNNVCLLAEMILDVQDASGTRRTVVGQRRPKRSEFLQLVVSDARFEDSKGVTGRGRIAIHALRIEPLTCAGDLE
jgi:hypothetical protein